MKILRRLIVTLLSRWGDSVLVKRVLDLETQLDAAKRMLSIAQAEAESMAGVIARDRERIKAEGACYARQRADAEGVANERRNSQSSG